MNKQKRQSSSPGLIALLERHGVVATGDSKKDLAAAKNIMPKSYRD